jgi:urease accessory protein
MRVGAQDPPWRVIRGFPLPSGGVLAHLHNVSGGILAGDRLHLELAVGAGAAAQVTTTGATRLYRHRSGLADSEQVTSIDVRSGGVLDYLPDPMIPFAGSRHKQRTTITLGDGATLFWWEVLAPGRQAMGETFAFERLQVSARVVSTAGPVLIEDFVLEPKTRALDAATRLGRHTHVATLYAFQPGRPSADFLELETQLNAAAQTESTRAGIRWGASALARDGVVVRGLSDSGLHLPATLLRFWNIARRFLVGVESEPPRKLK